jgi:hypothetical protein
VSSVSSIVSFNCDLAVDFWRQFKTSNFLSRSNSSRATFFTSVRSSAVSSGAGRVRVSKITSSSSLTFSRTCCCCSSVRLLDSRTSSSNCKVVPHCCAPLFLLRCECHCRLALEPCVVCCGIRCVGASVSARRYAFNFARRAEWSLSAAVSI